MHIALESPDQPEVMALIAALDGYLTSLYPPVSNHLLPAAVLGMPRVLFAVARDSDGLVCGCGAIVPMEGCGEGNEGELKRMYVLPERRGQGVGKAVLQFLEQQARNRGMSSLRLETGTAQPEALRLYERAGYVQRGPFGNYDADPLSVFMEKRL